MKKSTIIVDKDFIVAETDPHLFSSFVEPLGRCIYNGIYEPGHPSADENGFRQDVMEYIRPLNLTGNRFPGGNYTSTYRWEDSIGPKENRIKRPEVAWRCIEPNDFGIDEFVDWSRQNGNSEIYMTLNLATRGVLEAQDLVDYCNMEKGTYWSDKRREYGHEEPHNIKYWCLTNELDGPWQIGQDPYGKDYGRIARETAKVVKLLTPDAKTILCGSSNPFMDNYPEFDKQALDEAFEYVDYISLHSYFSNHINNTPYYLARSLSTDRFFKEVAGLIKYEQAKHRSEHQVYIAIDEFNTWHGVSGNERFEIEPWGFATPLLEDQYNFEDAICLGDVFITILKNADIVKIACVSEICNCISHIRTVTGGGCYVLPPYYTWLDYCTYGRGTVLNALVESPTYDAFNGKDEYRDVPYLNAVPVLQEDGSLVLFAVNKSMEEKLPLEMELRAFGYDFEVAEHKSFTSPDPKATNTPENPENCKPSGNGGNACICDGIMKADLEPLSWNVIRLVKK